jgi:hypothetical protein
MARRGLIGVDGEGRRRRARAPGVDDGRLCLDFDNGYDGG